jgi:hypothetical protein
VMEGCLLDRGYEVASWQKAPRQRAQAEMAHSAAP